MSARRLLLAAPLGLLLAAVLTAAGPSGAAAAEPAQPERVLPDEQVGGHPLERYEIWYSARGWQVGVDVHPRPVWPVTPSVDAGTSPAERVTGWATELLFGAVRVVVTITTAVVTWAYSFHLADRLAGPAAELAAAAHSGLIGPLGLRHFALFCAVVYAGWQLLRHRLAHGLGELGLSLVVLAVGGALLLNVEDAFRRGVGFTAGLSAAVLELATPGGGDARAAAGDGYIGDGFVLPTAAVDPLADGLRAAFVAGPHDLLNWGRPLTGSCAAAREELLAAGPHGTDEVVRERMAEAGCAEAAAFNARPSVERLLGAGLVLAAAGLHMLAVVLIGVTVIGGQFVAVILAALAPFAFVGGVLPGAGRQLLWRWAAACLRCIAVIVAMAGVLAFTLVLSGTLLAAPSDSLLERFGLLVILVAAGLLLRRKLLAAATTAVGNLDRRLETRRTGGTHGGGWMRPAAAGGVTGLGIAATARDGREDVRELADDARRARLRLARLTARAKPGGHAPGASAAAPRTGPAAAAVGTAGKTLAAGTVGLPVAGPRAAAHAAVTVGAKTAAVRRRLEAARGYGQQWRHGLTHPVRQYQSERQQLLDRRQGSQA